MKKVSAEVLNLDVEKLIEMLNAALCEEWLAYYQYWVGARIMEGPMRIPIEAELLEHANEELKHAEMLIENGGGYSRGRARTRERYRFVPGRHRRDERRDRKNGEIARAVYRWVIEASGRPIGPP